LPQLQAWGKGRLGGLFRFPGRHGQARCQDFDRLLQRRFATHERQRLPIVQADPRERSGREHAACGAFSQRLDEHF
jgi:hypothetical protein